MPHSTYSTLDPKVSSTEDRGFDRYPRLAVNTMTTTGKPNGSISLVGTAHSQRDERFSLPSQQNPNAWKRNSSPVIPEGFADLLRSGGNIDEVLANRRVGDRNSVTGRQTGDRTSVAGQHNNADKRRSQYYEEQSQYKDNVMRQTQDRVQRESPVVAELKTNVIIKDEFTLVTDLSYHLAQRYTKPDSSVMIKVDHSACLALGGTFDPCYIMTVTAVPSLMGPTTNKRNAALIQAFMADILSVPADRGIIKFQKIEDSDFAMNGTTMLGEIERLEKTGPTADSGNAVKRAITNASRKSMPTFNKKLPTKPDTDDMFNLSLTPTTPVESKRRSTANGAAPNLPDVFELPATDAERPSTSHGPRYAAENGLRMNGVSKEDLLGAAARTPNGRPKTFAGQTTSVQDELKAEPLPKIQRQASQQSQHSQRRSQHISHSAAKPAEQKRMTGNIPLSPKPTLTTIPAVAKSAAVPAQVVRPKETYIDNISTSTVNTMAKKEDSGKADPKLDAKAAERERAAAAAANKKDTEANTAKRRSTITATPKIPAPPPVPETKERKDQKFIGKRKSFLAAFRRSAAPA